MRFRKWELWVDIGFKTFGWGCPGLHWSVEIYNPRGIVWEWFWEIGLMTVEPDEWGAHFFGRIYEMPGEYGTEYPCGWRLWNVDLMVYHSMERRQD